MEKKEFINYALHLLDTKESVYYSYEGQYFYFYHHSFMFKIASTQSSASLVVQEERQSMNHSYEFSLTVPETQNFLKKIIPLLPSSNQNAQRQIEKLGREKFQETLNKALDYLKTHNPQHDIKRFENNNSLDNYAIEIPIDGVSHICRIGRVLRSGKKQDQFLTSIVEFPIFFLENNLPKSPCIAYDIMIAPWEIKEYPILLNFVTPKLFGEDFAVVFSHMIDTLPSGDILLKEIFDLSLSMPNKKSLAHKI